MKLSIARECTPDTPQSLSCILVAILQCNSAKALTASVLCKVSGDRVSPQ